MSKEMTLDKSEVIVSRAARQRTLKTWNLDLDIQADVMGNIFINIVRPSRPSVVVSATELVQ